MWSLFIPDIIGAGKIVPRCRGQNAHDLNIGTAQAFVIRVVPLFRGSPYRGVPLYYTTQAMRQ